jgi:hypothetical protein
MSDEKMTELSDTKWTKLNEEMSAHFSFPCEGCYYYVRHIRLNIGCDNQNDRHGHVELSCEDGYTFIRFCCYSQAGVKAVVDAIGAEEFKGVLDLEKVKALPQDLTEEEKIVIASPVEMLKQAKISGWLSS